MNNEKNTFEEMNKAGNQAVQNNNENFTTTEMNINEFSDKAVGEKSVKYIRPDLNNTEDVVDNFIVQKIKDSDPILKTQKSGKEYKKLQMKLVYSSKNKDGVINREFISGGRKYVQDDGTLSKAIFWYDGARTQIANLWVCVAKKLSVSPDMLSPKQFVSFLNTKPKVKIVGVETLNFGAKPGSSKFIMKNLPGTFL